MRIYRAVAALVLAGLIAVGGAAFSSGASPPLLRAARATTPPVARLDRLDEEVSPQEQQQEQKQEAEAEVSGNPSVAPFKWAGRLVYRDPQGKSGFSCSAQFVGKRVLLTAAHCLFDLDKNASYAPSNMSFILQYQNGTGTHIYHAVCSATLASYSYPANYASLSASDKGDAFNQASQWDYGMVLVDADSITGWFKVQTDWKGKWKGATRIGYPAAILGTRIVQRVHGLVFFADDIPIFAKSYPGLVVHWQDNSHFTSGSSGGAWVAELDSTEGADNNIVISLNSFHLTSLPSVQFGLPGAEFGPYLRSADYDALYKFTANGCK